MKPTSQMGLGNSLDEKSEILHTGVIGRNALGRICDLVGAWCEKIQNVSPKHVSDAQMMIQALLDFANPRDKQTLGQFEFSFEENQLFASVRFENKVFTQTDSVERTLSQYWLNSDEASNLKKLLYPKDRVEVRFNQALNLIEWRVCRSLAGGSVSHEDVSFLVLNDTEVQISTQGQQYTDLGDLPYQEWLSSVYRNQNDSNASGEFFVAGESLQNESEWARVVSDREAIEVNEEIRIKGSTVTFDESSTTVLGQALTEAEATHLHQTSLREIEELKLEFKAEQAELNAQVKAALLSAKKQELLAKREVTLADQKVQMFEKLLRKKELTVQKSQSEIRVLNQKIKEQAAADRKAARTPTSQAEASFKEKALQMYEQLKKVKLENIELEKRMSDFSQNSNVAVSGSQAQAAVATTVVTGSQSASITNNETVVVPAGVISLSYDDLNKKLERTQRALEAEKGKVKSLSERVILAEREAQSSGPMLDELERKVDTTLKTAQQHKKETEQVKQKLVQAEAEKNKVKNELVKVQAQVQTLMKRHAA